MEINQPKLKKLASSETLNSDQTGAYCFKDEYSYSWIKGECL